MGTDTHTYTPVQVHALILSVSIEVAVLCHQDGADVLCDSYVNSYMLIYTQVIHINGQELL